MLIPLVLIVLALAAMAVVAYGTHPDWMQYQHGLQLILWTRRLQWPLVVVALLLCLAVVALVISNQRRAWWLIGLGPVLALFVHRFATDRAGVFSVVENPRMVEVKDATFMADDDHIVTVTLGDSVHAYPYAALFRTPVVMQAEHEKRMVMLWSAYANRVLAFGAADDLRARDLEVVSTPANALLVYNARLGQFINGVTGLTPAGAKPTGFSTPLPTTKMTWRDWRAAHPAGRVMSYAPPLKGPRPPVQAILPAYAMRMPTTQPLTSAIATTGRRRVAVVGTTRPAAVETDSLSIVPLNTRADDDLVFVFRADGSATPRAYLRRFGDDIRTRFESYSDPKHPEVLFRDVDTQTHWNAAGVGIGGTNEFRGKRLIPVPVDEDVDWEVLRFWYPNLALQRGAPPPATRPSSAAPAGAGTGRTRNPTVKPRPTRRAPATR